jgi:hypothetical protein
MPTAVSANAATAVGTFTGTGMSDTFTVPEDGEYVFTTELSSGVVVLQLSLLSATAFQNQILQSWDAVANPSITAALKAAMVYRISATNLVGGTATVLVQSSTAASPPTKIAQFPLSQSEFTAIVAPIDCNYYWVIENLDGSALYRCSNPADPTTVYEIPQGTSYALIVPAVPANSPRFPQGSIVTYLKSAGGSGPAVMEFYL